MDSRLRYQRPDDLPVYDACPALKCGSHDIEEVSETMVHCRACLLNFHGRLPPLPSDQARQPLSESEAHALVAITIERDRLIAQWNEHAAACPDIMAGITHEDEAVRPETYDPEILDFVPGVGGVRPARVPAGDALLSAARELLASAHKLHEHSTSVATTSVVRLAQAVAQADADGDREGGE